MPGFKKQRKPACKMSNVRKCKFQESAHFNFNEIEQKIRLDWGQLTYSFELRNLNVILSLWDHNRTIEKTVGEDQLGLLLNMGQDQVQRNSTEDKDMADPSSISASYGPLNNSKNDP